jgi:hypothetical protein
MRSIVVFASFMVFCCFTTVSFAAPDLQVATPTFDFGEIYQGEKVPHVFEFTNQGDEPLLIDRVRSSCGCTAVLVSQKNIPPGGQGEVKATFDSSRFRGAINKTIYLYSNDPARPTMQLHLKGKVLEIVAVVPSQVNFGKVKAETAVTTTVVLRNQGPETLSLGQPNTTKPGLERFSGYVLVPVVGIPKNELRIPVYATIMQ